MVTILGNIDFSAFSREMAYSAGDYSIFKFAPNSWECACSPTSSFNKVADVLRSRMRSVCAVMTPIRDRLCLAKTAALHRVEDSVLQYKTEANHRVAHFSKTIPACISNTFETLLSFAIAIASTGFALVTIMIGRSFDCFADTVGRLNANINKYTTPVKQPTPQSSPTPTPVVSPSSAHGSSHASKSKKKAL